MTARRTPRKNTFAKNISYLLVLLVSMIALAVHATTSFAVADYALNRGRIHCGVSVYKESVSTLTEAEAKKKLGSKIAKAVGRDLIFVDATGSWPVEARFLKAKPDLSRGVGRAYSLGRRGSYLAMILERALLYLHPRDLTVPSDINNEYTTITMTKIASVINKPAVDATVEINGETATVKRSKDGWEVKIKALKEAIINKAADPSSRKMKVPQGVAKVKVHDADAAKAKVIALKMMKNPIDYSINSHNYTIASVTIGTLLGFVPEAKTVRYGGKKKKDIVLTPKIARDKLDQYFITMKDEFETKPVNARFVASEGAVTIVPGINGLVVDMDAAVKELNVLALAPPPRKATLKLKEVEPDLSTAKAEGMGIKERVSVHTENFDYTANRSKNIGTLAEQIDGNIVAPGQVWSINQASGPRTQGKGYTEAPVIINGQLSPDIGGGICNVSTTIFNTAFFAGYEIVERYAHDFYISHYPDGRDASIYYDGGMDFKFRNDSPYYMLIKTSHTDTSVTVAFYSTNTGLDVGYSDTGFTNIVPYGIVYKDDPVVPTGWEKDADLGYGVDGRDISVSRTVKKGGAVVREDKFTSHYEPKQRLVLKGTGPPLPAGTPPPPDLRPLGQTPR